MKPAGSPRRRTADPLASMHARGLVSATEFAAGLQLRELYQISGVSVASVDLAKIVVDGGRHAGANLIGAAAREKIAVAEAAVGTRGLQVLRAVVVEERPVTELHYLVPAVRDRNAANAVLMDRLVDALQRLAFHWRMHARKNSQTRSWRAA